MKQLLTRRQSEILADIIGFIQHNGYQPTYRDISSMTGLSSTATIHKHLGTLARKGYLRKLPGRMGSFSVVKVRAKLDCCPTCGHGKENPDVKLEARKLGSKVLQILDDDEMPPKETSERLQAVIAEALREARA